MASNPNNFNLIRNVQLVEEFSLWIIKYCQKSVSEIKLLTQICSAHSERYFVYKSQDFVSDLALNHFGKIPIHSFFDIRPMNALNT